MSKLFNFFKNIKNKTEISENPRAIKDELDNVDSNYISISPKNAFSNISAVYECVTIRANSLGKLPLQLFKKTSSGRERDSNNNLWYLLEKRPNKWQTPSQFKSYIEVSRLLWGNAYILIDSNTKGEIVSLIPLNPSNVTIKKNTKDDYIYEYTDDNGKRFVYIEDEIIHIPYVSIDGKIGKAPLEVARENATNLMYISKFEGDFYKKGTMTTGIIETSAILDIEAKKKIKKEWQSLYGGVKSGGSIAILDAGFNYKPITMPLKDAEFISSRKLNKLDIATIFGVPSFMLNDLDNAKFNNIEHQNMRYLSDVLQPTCTLIEEEFNYKLFTQTESKDYYVKFNLNASLRIDSKSRAEFYNKMLSIGAMSINEVRNLEELDSIGDIGDKHFISLNYTTLDTIEKHSRIKNE